MALLESRDETIEDLKRELAELRAQGSSSFPFLSSYRSVASKADFPLGFFTSSCWSSRIASLARSHLERIFAGAGIIEEVHFGFLVSNSRERWSGRSSCCIA